MLPRRHQSLVRRSGWWVFAALIATPAVVLTLLGLKAIRADEIERRQRLFDQQIQVARLADVALSTAVDREAARGTAFEIDRKNTVSFPAERVFIIGAGTVGAPDVGTGPSPLVEQARAADAQGRLDDAKRLYELVRSYPALRQWADIQLLLLQPHILEPASVDRVAAATLAASDARSPGGIPLSIVVCSLMEHAPKASQARFAALLEGTIDSLRAGRWWLSLDQRSAYDTLLRGWLRAARQGADVAPDPQLPWLSLVASVVAASFTDAGGVPDRSEIRSANGQRLALVWMRPDQPSASWRGAAVRPARVDTMLASAIDPLLKDQPFRVVLRERRSVVVGTAGRTGASRWFSLDSLPGWSIAFTDVLSGTGAGGLRVSNYARVLLPIVVLACGLAMTAWLMRREQALAELQSTFVAGVTHEFKSPITSIRLLMERIASGRLRVGDSPERYYSAIGVEVDRLEGLVNRLLESRKLESRQKEYVFRPAHITSIVSDVVMRLRPQAEARHIELALRIDGDIPAVPLDADSVTDAVQNLLDNAIKYSPDRTHVSAAIDAGDGQVRLTVADEGIGVDPADAERIFQPFFRSRRGDHASVRGTGLGLALVKATAEAHGGSVAMTSDGRRGSRFTLTLPVARGEETPEFPVAEGA